MQYVITGFTHNMGFRVFAFDGVGADRVRTEYRVKADLGLIKRYGIRMQELPLLCRGLLERRGDDLEPNSENREQRTFTYTEADMGLHADACATKNAAAQKKKAPRKRPDENVAAASDA
jgi:hypothetical protein